MFYYYKNFKCESCDKGYNSTESVPAFVTLRKNIVSKSIKTFLITEAKVSNGSSPAHRKKLWQHCMSLTYHIYKQIQFHQNTIKLSMKLCFE